MTLPLCIGPEWEVLDNPKESTLIGKLGTYRITAAFRKPDGSTRIEDLGEHEASTGQRAKARAIAAHAGRMGWRAGKRGPITTGWVFRIRLAGKP